MCDGFHKNNGGPGDLLLPAIAIGKCCSDKLCPFSRTAANTGYRRNGTRLDNIFYCATVRISTAEFGDTAQ